MDKFNEILITFFNIRPLKFFSIYGLVAMILLMLPSFLFMRKANLTRPADLDIHSMQTARMELITRIVLNFTIPLMRMPLYDNVFLYISAGILVLYYLLWVRFVIQGSYYPDIYMKTALGIPIPFDILNSLYLIFISIWLCNAISVTIAVIFAICRIANAMAARKDLLSRV
ncbi:MAG: hypothetical protein MJ171_04900 [Clostridia bacterium]|nr:hypothetical protein [Clostridia bacterium]